MRSGFVVVLVCLLFLAGCFGAGGQSGSGPGIETTILNQYEFSDVYFPYSGGASRPTPDSVQDSVSNPNADLYELFRFQTVVANTGRADALAAVYVTGYDPNLFVVAPLGPFVMDRGARSCWQSTVGLTENVWDAYIACVTAEDMFGVGVTWGDSSSVRVDTRNVNIGDLLNGIPRLFGQEAWSGFDVVDELLGPADINCNWEGERARGHFGVGSASRGCSFRFNFPDAYVNRPSRGALSLYQYGGMFRDCKNGCIIVPSPLIDPDGFLGGNTDMTPGGERVNLDIGVWVDRNRWPETYLDHQQLFQITTCSLYTTYITPSICMDSTPNAPRDSRACTVGAVPLEQNQGAPVRISRIDQVAQGPRMMFTLHVENTRGGRVFAPGAIDLCSPATPEMFSRELIDVVQVMDARVIGSFERLDCGEGIIRLRDGRGRINCFYDFTPSTASAGAYQTALNVELVYLYRDTQTVQASIHRI